MKRVFGIVLIFLLAVPATAQRFSQRKRPDIIPLEGQARRGGFYISPGLTYTLTRGKNPEEEVFRAGDTTYTAVYDPNGRPGLYLEAGWFYLTRDPVILDYWDVGLAYKNFRGNELYTGVFTRGDSSLAIAGEGQFAEQFLTVHANANKFIQIRDYQFIQISLGLNADYRIGSGYAHTGDPFLNRHEFPPNIVGQAHFKLGYGFKVTGNLLIIPALETPIFSVTPADEGRFGAMQWFSSNYRPLILSVRFMWLRNRKGFDCPPPIKHNGIEKSYKQDGYHPK